MRLILSIIFAVCACAVIAQPTNTNAIQFPSGIFKNSVYIPFGSTPALNGSIERKGALYGSISGADTALNMYAGSGKWYKMQSFWVPVSGGKIVNKNTGDVKIAGNLILDNGNIGFGISSPFYRLETLSDNTAGSSIRLGVAVDGTTSNSGSLYFLRSSGSLTSKTPVTNGQVLGALKFQGDTGVSTSVNTAIMQILATENYSSTASGSKYEFWLTPTGKNVNRNTMVLNDKGIGLNAFLATNRSSVYANLDIADTATDPTLMRLSYFNSDSVQSPIISFRRASGDNVTTSELKKNMYMGGIAAKGWNSSGFTTTDRVGIYFKSSEAWSVSNNGTTIDMNITPIASTVTATKLRISGGYTEVFDSLRVDKDIVPTTNQAVNIGSGSFNFLTVRATQLVSNSTSGLYLNSVGASGFINFSVNSAQVARLFVSGNLQLGTGTLTDIPSAIISSNTTTKGLLPPRLTTTQRDAISSPAEGLLVYNLTTHQMNYWNATSWIAY